MQIFTRPVPHLDEYENRRVAKTFFSPFGTQNKAIQKLTLQSTYIVNADIWLHCYAEQMISKQT